MPRTGKQALEIFGTKPSAKGSAKTIAPNASESAAAPARGRGRPKKSERDATSSATVVLYDAQIVQLDDIANQIRARSRTVIKRADLIRGILSAVLSAGIDLAGATSEEEIRGVIAARFSSPGKKGDK